MVDRDYSIDLLRVSAAIGVVLLHSAAIYLEVSPVNSFRWEFANIFDTLTRWAVPVFVMMSGAFLLKKEISLKLLYGKYIKHLFILLVCWNVIYNLSISKSLPNGIKGLLSLFLSPGGGINCGIFIC